MKKIFDALVDGSVALISRFLPDAYILVLLLTVILFVVAVPVTGIAPAEGITVADRLVNLVYDGWYGGFWNLLGFGMQMVLIVVTGTMFANTEPVHRIIVKIASIPKTPRQALLLVSAVGMVAYFLQWGAALIVCAVLAHGLCDFSNFLMNEILGWDYSVWKYDDILQWILAGGYLLTGMYFVYRYIKKPTGKGW